MIQFFYFKLQNIHYLWQNEYKIETPCFLRIPLILSKEMPHCDTKQWM